jgi:adenylate cyclase
VTIYEPLGLESEVTQATRDTVERFHHALALYRSQNWDAAEKAFAEIQKIDAERRLAHVFLDRIAVLRSNPPGEGWDGAFTFETK